MNNMKQWQQDISNVVDKNSLDIKNLQDNSDVGKLTVRIDNIEAKDREQDVQLSNHGEQLENLFNKINTDVADTKTEINNTIEQLRLNTNNSITALQTSTDRALDTIKQNTTDSLNSLKTSIDRNIELLKSNTADSITALQTSIDRHTEELDNVVRSVNGVTADNAGNVTIDTLQNKTPYLNIATDNLVETSPVFHGNITLSQSWRSFDALLVMLIDDNLRYMSPHVLDVKAFDKAISMMKALATGAGQKGVGLAAFGGLYWYIDPYTTTSYTFSFFTEENTGIHSIYGCYYRMH